jgi:hypothetical protein
MEIHLNPSAGTKDRAKKIVQHLWQIAADADALL